MTELHYRTSSEVDIPLYEQLAGMIRADIKSGRLPAGAKLPTVRELSDSCQIARGTVVKAYDELEKAGEIEKIQGRGTFVALPGEPASRKDRALEAIDRMLDTMEELGFSSSETEIYLNLRLRERSAGARAVKVAFVDCNRETILSAGEQIRALGNIELVSCRIDELREYPYRLGDDIDLTVVSASHADELKAILPDLSSTVKAALSLVPASAADIVRIPAGSRTGIICASRRFGELIKDVCSQYNPSLEVLEPVSVYADIREYANEADVLLVPKDYSRFCDPNTAALLEDCGRKKPVICCEYRIDEGSLINISDRIDEIRENNV